METQETYWRDTLSQAVAIAADDREDVVAINKIRQIVAGQKAVMAALAWPKEQLRLIGNAEARHQPSVSQARGGFR